MVGGFSIVFGLFTATKIIKGLSHYYIQNRLEIEKFLSFETMKTDINKISDSMNFVCLEHTCLTRSQNVNKKKSWEFKLKFPRAIPNRSFSSF